MNLVRSFVRCNHFLHDFEGAVARAIIGKNYLKRTVALRQCTFNRGADIVFLIEGKHRKGCQRVRGGSALQDDVFRLMTHIFQLLRKF